MNRLTKAFLLTTVLLIAAASFYGCGKRPEVIQSEFAKLISTEESTVTPESMMAAAQYMDENLRDLDKEGASQMLVAYEEYAAQYINTDADSNQVQSLLPYYSEKDGQIKDDKIKKDEKVNEYYGKLINSYICIYMKDGKTMLRPDYGRLDREFGKRVTLAVQELYEIKTLVSEHPATENATLQISYQELLSRAGRVEQLISENKKDLLIADDAKWMYDTYLNMIMVGTTNSPLFDYQTGEFSVEANAAYKKFVKENPDSSLTWALNAYYKYLKSVDYKINYKDSAMSKAFFDTCALIATETEKRVYQ